MPATGRKRRTIECKERLFDRQLEEKGCHPENSGILF